MRPTILALTLLTLLLARPAAAQTAAQPPCGAVQPDRISGPLVLMTDFGLKDGAVSEVRGVAYSVSPQLVVTDLTHEVPAGDIWRGSYWLYQTAPYWRAPTVFVGVVDPGVGTSRRSIVVRTCAGRFYVLPDNGLVTLVAEAEGVNEVRTIDESRNRLKGSEASNTFYGRDVFGYVGARLAAGVIGWSDVGPLVPNDSLVKLAHTPAQVTGGAIQGNVPALDVQYGNVWSNIPREMLGQIGVAEGDRVNVRIFRGARLVNQVSARFVPTFGSVPVGQPLVYINSLLKVSVALNQGNYARAHGIASGPEWRIEVTKAPEKARR